jgi:hypothetical protein
MSDTLSVESLVYWLEPVACRATNDWTRTFARSVLRQSRRRGWKPSPKQEAIMHRLLSEHLSDEEPDLFEEAG